MRDPKSKKVTQAQAAATGSTQPEEKQVKSNKRKKK